MSLKSYISWALTIWKLFYMHHCYGYFQNDDATHMHQESMERFIT